MVVPTALCVRIQAPSLTQWMHQTHQRDIPKECQLCLRGSEGVQEDTELVNKINFCKVGPNFLKDMLKKLILKQKKRVKESKQRWNKEIRIYLQKRIKLKMRTFCNPTQQKVRDSYE